MYRRWFLATIAPSFLFVAGNSQGVPANLAPVQVFVSATSKDGMPAAVDPSTLSVSIDKQPAQILSVRPAKDDELLFAVMLDTSSSQRSKEKALKDTALKIFQALTSNQSRGYLVLFDVQAYPSKRPLLPTEVQSELDRMQFGGGTALYDSVVQVCSGVLSQSKNPGISRRLLIILSDGDDNYSHIVADKMEEEAEREGIAIFSLPNSGAGNSPEGLETLRRFAKDTGGTEVLVNKQMDGATLLVLAVQSQTALSLGNARPRDGKLHSVAVKSSEKGLSVSAPARILIPMASTSP